MRKIKYTEGSFKLKVKKSKAGKGLFTETDIPKNSCVTEYIGVDVAEADQYKINSRYLFEISKNRMINGNIPKNIARYINHSCAPNCEAGGPSGKVFISTIKNIKAGEELTYNYGKEYFDEYFKEGGCRCNQCKV